MSGPRLVDPLESRTLLSAQFVADLNPAPGSSDPANAVQVNGVTLFVANDGAHGREVWRTDGTPDGTPEGTALLRDLIPGPAGSDPVIVGTVGNLAIIKQANQQLWQTDGTAANTRALSSSSGPTAFGSPTAATSGVIGNEFYFTNSNRLYRIRSAFVTEVPLSQNFDFFTRVVSTGSKLYMSDDYGRIWISDGTTNGTRALQTVYGQRISDLAQMGNAVYFSRYNSTTSKYEFWKTQGTEATTTLVTDTLPDAAQNMTTLGQTLYFWAGQPLFQRSAALWKSDGTTTGTALVKNVPFPRNVIGDQYPPFTASGGKLYFADCIVSPTTAIPKLWVTDGTSAGTVAVSTAVVPRPSPSPGDRPVMFDLNGTLLFQGSDAAGGTELWKTDGTSANTVPVADIVPGADGSSPQFLATIGTRVLLSATQPASGRELWTTDGTTDGTAPFKDLNPGTDSAAISQPVSVNGKLVFTLAGVPYVIPAPSDPPQRLAFADPSIEVSGATHFAPAGGLLYFTATVKSLAGTRLCVTDGTPQGTRVLNDLSAFGNLDNFVALGDRLYFTGGNYGSQSFYVTNGTDQGTAALASGFAFITTSTPTNYVAAVAGRVYFSAEPGSTGPHELWTTDGTPGGTARVISFTSPTSFFVNTLTPANGRLYFRGGDSKLYQTTGTPAGTSLVGSVNDKIFGVAPDKSLLIISGSTGKLMRLGPADPAPVPLGDLTPDGTVQPVQMGKWLYFVAGQTSVPGPSLWRTDGTAAGTTFVTSVWDAETLTAAGNLLFFTDTALHKSNLGRELWATDGTPGGTYLVADIIPGPTDTSLANLTAAGDILYFTALDGVHGRELWRAIDDVPPAAVASSFNYAANPRTLTVTFTQNLANSLTLGDWKLVDRTSGDDASYLLTSLTFDADSDTATLNLASSLPNGDYCLTLPAGAAADPAGNPTAADVTLDFFQLAGDLNRDRTVNFTDLLTLTRNYNHANVGYANGDLNGDGLVNFADLLTLTRSYGITLAAPPPPAPASVAPTIAPLSSTIVTTSSRPKPTTLFSTQPIPFKQPAPPRRPAPPKKSH